MRRDDRLIRSVDALVAAGDGMGAAALVPIVESLRETPLRDAVLAYLAILRGRATEADVRLKRAWDIVNADREPETAALIATRHVLHSLALCRGDELVTWADRAISLAGRDSAAGVEAAAIRGLGLAMAGRFEDAHEAYALAARRVGHSAQTQRVTMGRGWLDVLSDEPDEARSRLEGVTDPRVLGGSTRISMWALAWLARVQFLTGEGDAALQTVAAGRALAAESGIALVTPLLEWTATETHLLRGSWEEAARTARAAEIGAQGYEIMRVARAARPRPHRRGPQRLPCRPPHPRAAHPGPGRQRADRAGHLALGRDVRRRTDRGGKAGRGRRLPPPP